MAWLVCQVSFTLLGLVEPGLRRQWARSPDKELLEEASAHLDHVSALTCRFVGRVKEYERLVAAVDTARVGAHGTPLQPVIITGACGVGKSTLAAMLGVRTKLTHPGAAVIYRFARRSLQSLNARRLLASIVHQLSVVLEGARPAAAPSPAEEEGGGGAGAAGMEGLRARLELLLANASADEPVMLIVDGLEDLETPHGFEPDFTWVPKVQHLTTLSLTYPHLSLTWPGCPRSNTSPLEPDLILSFEPQATAAAAAVSKRCRLTGLRLAGAAASQLHGADGGVDWRGVYGGAKSPIHGRGLPPNPGTGPGRRRRAA